MHLETVLKTSGEKKDFTTFKFLGVDLRIAHSTEETMTEPTLKDFNKATRKYRQSFKSSSENYVIDFTAITDGTLTNDETGKRWVVNPEVKEIFQIEVELLSNKVTVNEILGIISKIVVL